MFVDVWLIAKKGEDRIYANTVPPAKFQMDAWRRDGFKIYRVNVRMPSDWDEVDAIIDSSAVELAHDNGTGQRSS